MRFSRRGFLGLAAAPVALRAATLERFPYLQNLRADRATVLWTTREPGSGVVEYSSDLSFSRTAPARVTEFPESRTNLPFTFYQYEADLTPLRAGTEYSYRVRFDGESLGTPALFRTAAPGPFSFVLIGDTGSGSEPQRAILRRIAEEPRQPAFVIHTGDMAYPNGSFAEFERNHFAINRDLMQRLCFFPAPGNHEYWTDSANPFVSMHSLPSEGVPPQGRGRYYSLDWGGVHFVFIDSNTPNNQTMLDWLDRDLGSTRQYWKIAVFHHPPYTDGHHENSEGVLRVRERIVPHLEKHHVQIVFTGHDHNYQRTKALLGGEPQSDPHAGPKYVITGGGGGGLFDVVPDSPQVEVAQRAHHYVWVDVNGGSISLRAMAIDPDRQIDRVTWAPPPVISTGGVVNAGDFTGRLAAGGIVSIFGRQLAAESRPTNLPLPVSMAGVQASLDGRPLRLFFVSPGQLNAQIPFDATGPATLRVVTPGGSAEVTVEVKDVAPAIPYQGPWAAIAHADSGVLVTESTPALAGEALIVYALGLGACHGEVADGEPAPSAPLFPARAGVRVRVGTATVQPQFAGLTPGFAGLYQVNIQVPSNLPWGMHDLELAVGAAKSNIVALRLGWPEYLPEGASARSSAR